MSTAMRATGIVAAFLTLLTCAAGGEDMRSFLRQGAEGPYLECQFRPSADQSFSNGSGVVAGDGRRGHIIWHNHLADAIYQRTSISMADSSLCAGTYLNLPREAELIPLEGPGIPDWTYPGTDFQVAASRNAEVVAGVDHQGSDVVVYKWHPDSATPDWSYTIQSAGSGGVRAIVVSPDGSTIAVVVTMQNPQFVRLYCFDCNSSFPIGTCDASSGTFARNLDISADGRYIAFIATADAYVFDRDTAALRWSGSMGATNDPIAISGSGNYLAYGWMTLYVREWNGATYAQIWTFPGGNYSLKTCRFSLDESTLAAGWYRRSTYDQNRIQLYDMPSATPLWTHLYPQSSGSHQDVPWSMALTADGGYVLVGSWGDQMNTNPEVQIFEHASPDPILMVDTPGSVFNVDIAGDGAGGAYVAACGKHVHANQSGRGGDLYSIRVRDISTVAEEDGQARRLALGARPNPFTSGSVVRFILPDPGRARVSLHSPDGRLVRVLADGVLGVGSHVLTWDGMTQWGRAAAPGIYLLRLEAAAQSASRRIILVQ